MRTVARYVRQFRFLLASALLRPLGMMPVYVKDVIDTAHAMRAVERYGYSNRGVRSYSFHRKLVLKLNDEVRALTMSLDRHDV